MASKRKREYFEYLKSDHWRALRYEAFKRDKFRCQRCGRGKNLQGHHKTYRKDLTLCTVKDIMTICDLCHRKLHRDKTKERKARRKKRQKKPQFEQPDRPWLSHAAWMTAEFGATEPVDYVRMIEAKFSSE